MSEIFPAPLTLAMNQGLVSLGVPPPGMMPMVVNHYGGPNPLLSSLGQIPLPSSAPPSQDKLPEAAMISQIPMMASMQMESNLPDKLLDSDIIMEDSKKNSSNVMRLSDELLATMNSGPPPGNSREGRERRPRRDRWERSPEDRQWQNNREEFNRPQTTSVQERLRNLAHGGDFDGGR
jgi:hypothetical protein